MGLIHYQAAPSEPSLRLTHQPHTNRPTRGPTINLPAPLTPPCGRLLGQQLPSTVGGSLGDCCLSSLPALLTGVVFFLFLPATTFTTIPRVFDLEEQQPTDKQLSLISPKNHLVERHKSQTPRCSVRTLTGKEIELNVEGSDKVSKIKELVEEKEGIPPVQQRLIFGGKQMVDDKTADDYGLEGGATLHLVLALRGGL
ncbi:Putative protein of unknown function [Podospora comata]|uniref:Ubiquitin-like domain-containing protein n=1 Tax=Podospora comata TaxID=48703 RepID=A0ABY6RVA5_PODCO|nr:Putative protein of unknown function [Podospora comata]